MKNILVHANDLLIFVIELAALYFLATFAYRYPQHYVPKIVVATVAVVLFGIIWGIFFSPAAQVTIPPFLYFLLKTLLLLFPAFLHFKERPGQIIVYTILLLLSTLIQILMGRGDWK